MKKTYMLDLDRVEELMKEKGWQPGQLAYQSGVVYDTIYKLRKTSRPRTAVDTVAKLADAFDVSIDYLMGMTDNRTRLDNAAPDRVVLLMPDAKRRQMVQTMVESVAGMDDKDLDLIVAIVDRLAAQKRQIKHKSPQEQASLAADEREANGWLDLIEELGGAELRAQAIRKLGLKTTTTSDRAAMP